MGDQLELRTTLCHEARLAGKTIAFDQASANALYSDAIIHAGFDPVDKSSDAVRLGQAPAKIPFEGFDHDFSSATSGDSGARGNAVEPDPVARIATSIAGVSTAINVLPAEALGPLAP